MDNRNTTGGGVKVTYIETQFVTSDAAGFKDLVQRLTGRSSAPPAPAHRPRPCRPYNGRRGTTAATGAAAAGPQGYHHHYTVADQVHPAVAISRTTPAYDLEGMDLHDVIDMGDFSDLLLYVSASERSNGCYGGFPC